MRKTWCVPVLAWLILAGGSILAAEAADAVAGATADAVDQSMQIASFARTTEMRASPTGYGGSVPVQKLDLNPELKQLFAGSGFAKDYKEDRGHAWAWTDLKDSGRVNDKTPAACLVCKTPYVSELYRKTGWAFAAQPVRTYLAEDHPTISCETCHEPGTGALRVIQPGFVESLQARKIDFARLPRTEQETLTCAQCHVEYYFEPGTNRVVHPLTWGTSPEAMYTHYQTQPGGFKADFIHPQSGAPLLKAQHPDYEEFTGGVHAQAGLSCADCHMPGGSHDVTSPLFSIEASCLKCHTGRSAEWLLARVKYNQDSIAALQSQVGQDIARTHQLVGDKAARLPPAQLEQARQGLREAQWYWDYVAAANSMGAHNPVGGLRTLAKALRLAAGVRELVLSARD
jgi:nitrite reductase (cytochrome c-552)